jgi:GT2 family glycosyltransferase
MKIAKLLSIVIASCEREELLARLLKSLEKQLYPTDIEIILIRNTFGLARARNLGWRQAHGVYIAFIDDDAIPGPKWVKSIRRFIQKHPNVEVFGGPYESENKADIPRWIPKYLTRMVLRGAQSRQIRLGQEWLTGTNMIFTRRALKKLGGFNDELGVSGKRRGYGEETDLLIRLHNAGYAIWYDPAIRVTHTYALWKQNLLYLLKDQYILGRNSRSIFADLRVKKKSRRVKSIAIAGLRPGLNWRTRTFYLLRPVMYGLGLLEGVVRSYVKNI